MICERQIDFVDWEQRIDKIKTDIGLYVVRNYQESHIVNFNNGKLYFLSNGECYGAITINENNPEFESKGDGNYRIDVLTSDNSLDNIILNKIKDILKRNDIKSIEAGL